MLLAGDIGGTKTLLGIFAPSADRPRPLHVRAFQTLEFESLADIVVLFLDGAAVRPAAISAASFGVAGPVLGGVARLTNVPWVVDASDFADRFGLARVGLLNDLQAMAHAVPVLDRDELAVLQEGDAVPGGNAALIAAGTGLGQALLHNVGGRFIPFPSEGGHADFAARTAREMDLVRYLTNIYGRADCEAVLSGPGLVNLHRFVHTEECSACDDGLESGLAPSDVTQAAMDARCPLCIETLEMFVSAYGAEAGNLALRAVATAGVYIGGGIAPKILPALETGVFMDAFRAKEPMADLLASVPVKVILNEETGLLGAAVAASEEG
jgi:glucokinase